MIKKIRIGIIGMGNIGRFHAAYLLDERVKRCELTAVCSLNTNSLESFRPLAVFNDGEELIRSGLVDAVLIATPHPLHRPMGVSAMRHGIHVLVEKPIASHKSDAQLLIDAHLLAPDIRFAGMFQMRVEPRYQKIRELIATQLGRLERINWINTDWFRTEAYYSSSAWRATWSREGGGVLINQCLHNLDTLQWLCGMPSKVRGFCQLGRFHNIEVEDSVTAYMEWAGGENERYGATGTFISSSGESPGTNRLEIVGSRGSLVLEHGHILLKRLSQETEAFSRNASQGFVQPEFSLVEFKTENAELPHALITQNFVDSILDEVPLIAPGVEGIRSVELANAMLFSSLQDRTLDLPMDGVSWAEKLSDLAARSTLVKTVKKVSTDDFSGSFKR